MKKRLPVFATLFLVIILPVATIAWGTIDQIRYKIKGSDGNVLAPLLSRGRLVKGIEYPGTITFTFDDGPDHRTTPIILDELDKVGIKAAFFVNGHRFHQRSAGGVENRAILREVYQRGHFIGNHTFAHKDITILDDAAWRVEVLQVEQLVREITGRRPWLFRPPFGRVDGPSLTRLAAEGYTTIMWNLDPLDWKAATANQLVDRSIKVIEENPDGGVFLLHDTNRNTAEAFPLIIEWIEERNAHLRAVGKRPLKIVGIEHYITRHRH